MHDKNSIAICQGLKFAADFFIACCCYGTDQMESLIMPTNGCLQLFQEPVHPLATETPTLHPMILKQRLKLSKKELPT